VKVQVVESGKWNCDRCRSERLQLLEEKLQKAVLQIDELKRKNKAVEEVTVGGSWRGSWQAGYGAGKA
jgi:hypothetical protein